MINKRKLLRPTRTIEQYKREKSDRSAHAGSRDDVEDGRLRHPQYYYATMSPPREKRPYPEAGTPVKTPQNERAWGEPPTLPGVPAASETNGGMPKVAETRPSQKGVRLPSPAAGGGGGGPPGRGGARARGCTEEMAARRQQPSVPGSRLLQSMAERARRS